jgi:hypothetical protein
MSLRTIQWTLIAVLFVLVVVGILTQKVRFGFNVALTRPVVIAIAVVLLLAATFSACSYVTWHELDRLTKLTDSGSMAARVLIAAANFWARYALFLTIFGITSIFTVRRLIFVAQRILSRFR